MKKHPVVIEPSTRNEQILNDVKTLAHDILDTVDEAIYIVDLITYEVIFANRVHKELFGETLGQPCWKKLQTGQTGPCSFCTNSSLLNKKNEPTGVHHSLYKNTLTNSWYQCCDRAMKWHDGRMVAVKTSVDVSHLKETSLELNTLLLANKQKKQDIIQYIEGKRRQMSYDLHDEMGQIGTAIKLNIDFLRNSLRSKGPLYDESLRDLSLLVERLRESTKSLAKGLNPRGFITLLTIPEMLQGQLDEWAARSPNKAVTLECSEALPVPSIEIKETIYRICQEALTNVTKHSSASEVHINFSTHLNLNPAFKENTAVELRVSDNGIGFPESINANSLGLNIMRDRVELLGGNLTLARSAQGGVEIRAEIPYAGEIEDNTCG